VADGVYAGVQAVEATATNPSIDCVFAKAKLKELLPRHDPVLPLGQLGNPGIRSASPR